MEEKLSGIVLSSINYGENDKILNIFTLEKGMVSARIKGVKKAGAKLKFASQPFCFAEYVFSTTLDKRIVIGASLIDSFYPICQDIVKFYSAGVVLEFTKKFAKEEIVSPKMFVLLIETLKKIAYTDIFAKLSAVRFLTQALQIVGYGLHFDSCFICGNEIVNKAYFDYLSGCFYCENCCSKDSRQINISTYQTLKEIDIKNEFDQENIDRALKLLDFYIVNKTEENIASIKELVRIK